MVTAKDSNHSLLIGALGFSLFFHIVMVVSIMNIEIPKETSRKDFESWVKHVAPRREAVLIPEAPSKALPETKTGAAPEKAEESGNVGSAKGSAKGTEQAQGSSTASAQAAAAAAKSARRSKVMRASGVLGLIGVASQGSSGSSLGNVFSENSGSVSEDVGAAMEGKQGVELANSSNISRKSLKGSGGTGGPAEVGGVSSGSVSAGQHEESDLPVARVSSSGGEVVSGNVNAASALTIIARKNTGFTRCYERGLKNNAHLAGKVSYEISVGGDGGVLDVRFVEDTLKAPDVLDCIKGILLRLRFSPPQGGAAIFSSVLVFGTN